MLPMKSWIDYWNTDTPIYVNSRHQFLHYRGIAHDMRRLLRTSDKTVLDFGCGEALCADEVAAACETLFLCDAAPNVRLKLNVQFEQNAKIRVLAPEDLAGRPDGEFDVIIANSVLQYVSRDDLKGLLNLWRSKLTSGGRLILADVIPPGVGPLTDARALLDFAFHGGFFVAACVGLLRTAVSDYRTLRANLGLSTYGEAEMLTLLAEHGYGARRLAENIGHNPARMCFEATPA
ncbi:MAG: class I SAM-dependent methyltransferase [Beijerinckiaceae bacterium]|nr:class I SAM-dependent methyltransferase [Beijerinckiaceae bacterium]